jgi:cell division septal protein FtsQ
VKLKRQPRRTAKAGRAGAASGRGARPARGGARPRGRQARRPGPPLQHRVASRLPSLGRLLAALGAAALAAGLVALLSGPWLRVTEVSWAGDRHTDADDLDRLLAGQRGRSVLTVDTHRLQERLQELPAVKSARVEALLPGAVRATVVERQPAFVWQTTTARLLGASDGTLFAALPRDAALPTELSTMPLVDDDRDVARLMTVGDVVPAGLTEMARRLSGLDPAALGSAATRLTVRLDDQYGFLLVSTDPAWRIAFGTYGHDPDQAGSEDAAALVDRQASAVRTLFATEPEATVGWVDVRNPGKVYFRGKG